MQNDLAKDITLWITSNITTVNMRRDLQVVLNAFAEYEICFGNRFHVVASGANIKSTGFNISGFSETLYMTDTPNADMLTGVISFISIDDNGVSQIVFQAAGYVYYVTGKVTIYRANITNTQIWSGIIESQAFPESKESL